MNNSHCDTPQKRTSIKGLLPFFFIGIFFGITMTQSEAVSWFRIYEMFRFESFHMYGIIMTAVILGVMMVAWIKKTKLKNLYLEPITFTDKAKTYKRYILGGIIFGLGWALAGACPGPMFTLLGNGITVILVVIASAMLGTFTYGLVKNRLPH